MATEVADKTIESLEAKRQEVAKKCKSLDIISIIFGIISVIILLVAIFVQIEALFITFGVILAIAFVCEIISAGQKVGFKRTLVDNLYNAYATIIYQNPYKIPENGIDPKYIAASQFYKPWDRYLGKNFFRATYNGVEFYSSDFELQDYHYDSENKTSYYTTYAKGIFFVFNLHKAIRHDFIVQEKSFGFEISGVHQLNKIEFESFEYNKKYNTTCDDKLYAFYIGTPKFIEGMMQFENSFAGTTSLRIVGDKVYVAINNYSSKFKFRIKTPITQEYLHQILDEIAMPKRIIDMLDLDNDKLNKYVEGEI
jgi:hypothetical protein